AARRGLDRSDARGFSPRARGAGAMRRLLAMALLLAGCGYDSQYTPPLDGRARPRWVGNHLSNNLAALPPACADQTACLTHPARRAGGRLRAPPFAAAAVGIDHPLPLLPPPHLPPPIGWRPVGGLVSGGGGRDASDALRAFGIILAVVAAPITAVTLA